MSVIEDGKGTSKKARVSDTNRLDVSAKSNGRIYYVSRDDKKVFSVNLQISQASGGTTENLGYIKNNGTNHLHINSITFSTAEPSTGLTKFGIWVNQTVNESGTEKIPTNLNLTSSLTSVAICYEGPGLTFSEGESIGTIRLSGAGSFDKNYDDALILGRSNILTIKVNAATTGTQTVATIVFWEHD